MECQPGTPMRCECVQCWYLPALCWPGYFASQDGQPVCLSCDLLGDFYQTMPSQTYCVACPKNTQRFLGLLDASTKRSCQCKEGNRLLPDVARNRV